MYYILNHTNHIIAADNALLKLLSVNNIGELHQNIALEQIGFTIPTDNDLEITTSTGSTAYAIKSHTLTGVLGELTLVEIEEAKESTADLIQETQEETTQEETTVEDTFSLIDDEPITFNDGNDTLIEESEPLQEKEVISILEDDTPFDLISDDLPVAEETVEPEVTTEEIQESNDAIFIDINKISEKIGISADDYNNFLNEYIDTALTLEDDLKSTDADTRSHAVSTISHLSNVLHLPVISEIMEEIEESDAEVQTSHIQSFYNTLAKLTTNKVAEHSIQEQEVEEPSIKEDVTAVPGMNSFGTIDLSGVQPIHFDFQLEEAANDLSLPVELIEEFVIDFIDQARTETDKMLEAYEKGDLDAIQKIGHLLKGTSSNLRINPLADTLYKIQFCEDSNQLEELIKDYWGHFLSFEHQINITSK